jgi:hypothetical protein
MITKTDILRVRGNRQTAKQNQTGVSAARQMGSQENTQTVARMDRFLNRQMQEMQRRT